MSNMNRRSLDPEGKHVSPLGTGVVAGRLDQAYSNLVVKLLYYPEEQAFKRMVYKAVTATRGNDVSDTEFDSRVVDDAFSGGLNQCLEWATCVFEISGVSRGLTHEIVRTRKASFAQQSMRHTDMGDPAMRMPEYISAAPIAVREAWLNAVETAAASYQRLVEADVPYQDARTVLPIATETYIIAAYPLSEFINTYAYRACYMFYPEIVVLFREMRRVLVEACPWLEPHILVSCEKTRPNGGHAHMCTYQGWEAVEGHCPLAWAKEDNRVWKSKVYGAEGPKPETPKPEAKAAERVVLTYTDFAEFYRDGKRVEVATRQEVVLYDKDGLRAVVRGHQLIVNAMPWHLWRTGAGVALKLYDGLLREAVALDAKGLVLHVPEDDVPTSYHIHMRDYLAKAQKVPGREGYGDSRYLTLAGFTRMDPPEAPK